MAINGQLDGIEGNMIILLNTMTRSGSTWAFNVMQDIFKSLDIDYTAKMADDEIHDEGNIKLLKGHDVFNILHLKAYNVRYITCIRDPKEAISSMYRAKNGQMDDDEIRNTLVQSILILEHISEYIKSGGRVLILDHNDIKKNSVNSYLQIIDHLGITPANLEEIIENNSKLANLTKLKKRGILDKDFKAVDNITQWHGNHISDTSYDLLDLKEYTDEMNKLDQLYRYLLEISQKG
jgi:hypothetical protein